MKILAKTFRFDKGQLQVINLPEVKYQTLDNYDASTTLKQHIFKAKECKNKIISLCKKVWCSEDGEYAQDFLEMDNESFKNDSCCKICIREYNKAVAYARAHPIGVKPEDVEKIKQLVFSQHCTKEQWLSMGEGPYRTVWQPEDNKEYKLEGVRMEIKEEGRFLFKKYPNGDHKGIKELVQVACLIEDDK